MNPSGTLSSTFWAMIVVQTIGSSDIFTKGPRKLPAPKQFVAIGVLWAIFHLFEGTRYARLASAAAVVTLLAGIVLGPFGGVVLSFLAYVSSRFSLVPASKSGGGASEVSPSAPPSSGPVIRPRGVTA